MTTPHPEAVNAAGELSATGSKLDTRIYVLAHVDIPATNEIISRHYAQRIESLEGNAKVACQCAAQLVQERDSARCQLTEYRELLRMFVFRMKHRPDCTFVYFPYPSTCTCGLYDLLERYNKVMEEK